MKNGKLSSREVVEKFQTRNPFIISDKLGIKVNFTQEEIEKGGRYVNIKGKDYIFINDKLSQFQKTFICARELGRFMLIKE